MTVDVFQQSRSFFDPRNPLLDKSILQVQTDPSSPQPAQLSSATGLLLPDLSTAERMGNFPPDLYDLRSESHLVRFVRALIGDSGVGQLRKKYLLARLQSALTSTHFYDLDRFYGALFGAQRSADEILSLNPLVGMATSDEWDGLHAQDAMYRERIVALAKAIPMGGTISGLQAAAEAVTGVPCDVYESWALIDAYGSAGSGRLWDQVEALYPTWDDTVGETWQSLSGSVQIGRTEANNRSEFIVRPKKDYDSISDPDERSRVRAEDEYSLIRVLSVLKPAGMLLTVDYSGIGLHRSVPIFYVTADSEFWEINTKVTPRAGIRGDTTTLYPFSPIATDITLEEHTLPRPPFTQFQGETITYNAEIVSVRSYTESAPDVVINNQDYEIVTYFDGQRVVYSQDKAVMDIRQALSAHYATDGILVAHPYAGEHEVVTTHG